MEHLSPFRVQRVVEGGESPFFAAMRELLRVDVRVRYQGKVLRNFWQSMMPTIRFPPVTCYGYRDNPQGV
ncbi:MAG: hypothetical protein B7Z60_01170 [Ferrovum sp. 37-45-19]|nr:MAG: hypothetical protein B7Z65_00055 [Ferrovum sp. 21-44-67]OYV95178.1 MAG: hypothetical protein B7Z60_01170 [Ferrovum sp. 37-45-19]OZB33798.1 MAG: hypothetical protein B7X47_03520 [Ferrovum sp. 34-44-207]